MNSLVLELQQDALNPQTKVADLLRKALVVAAKLKIDDFRVWIESELHGYSGEGVNVPTYRNLKGELKASHPDCGLIPYVIGNSKTAEAVRTRPNHQPVGVIEHLIEKLGTDQGLQIPFPPSLLKHFGKENIEAGIIPTVIVSRAAVYGIIDAVRTIILEWSLKLEAQGIIGEGLSFSSEEKQRASHVTFNIQNFSGIAGNVHAANLQIGDNVAIHAELSKRGILEPDRNELVKIIDELKNATGEKRDSLLKQGLDWTLAHARELGTLAEVVRNWFQS